jgi:D-3-phosphoglycerate dehydrogenase
MDREPLPDTEVIPARTAPDAQSGISTPTVDALILDLLEWLGRADRSYAETLEAWRTSCPKLPVWEDASDRGLVRIEAGHDGRAVVRVTPAGEGWLRARRPRQHP